MRNYSIFFLICLFLSCSKNGDKKSITYYDNGNLKRETIYVENKKIIIKDFYDNGNLKCLSERNTGGQEHGKFQFYYPSGRLKQDFIMENGKIDGIAKNYYENGQLAESTKTKSGEVYGCCKHKYRKDGSLRWTGVYNYFGELVFIAKFNSMGELESTEGENLTVAVNKDHITSGEKVRIEIERLQLPTVENEVLLTILKNDKFHKKIAFSKETLSVLLEHPGNYIFKIKSTHKNSSGSPLDLIDLLNGEQTIEIFVE